MTYTHSIAIAVSAICAVAQSIGAQMVVLRHIRGAVTTVAGAPVAAADVFLLESLEGATTSGDGKFVIRTRERDTVTLVVRHLGFRPVQKRVIPGDSLVAVVMEAQAASLTPFVVQAGAYTASDDRRASLTARQVASTPGATADVARAIQTLPGVQNVDEGTGLFVRGGDVSETKVLLNDALMLSPYNYETPTGNFTTSVNPFLLEGIFFSPGGFGARYGNVLSGIADLHTQGRPIYTSMTAVAGLASISGGASLALSHGVGVHATATRSDTDLLFRLNGSTRDYVPPPRGHDLSGSVIWNYRPTGEIRSFTIDRTNTLGISSTDPASAGGYASDSHSFMTQTGWKDVFGAFAPMISASYAEANRDEQFGPFSLGNVERLTQIFAQTAWSIREGKTIRAGGDLDRRDSRFEGRVPSAGKDIFDSRVTGARGGEFVEGDVRISERLRVVSGLRSDRASLTQSRTFDPRLSAAFQLTDAAALTAAWGVYHQVADPLYYDRALGAPGLAAMRSQQAVVGFQAGRGEGAGAPVFRLELYDKQYADLAQFTPDRQVVGKGTGRAQGADLFLKVARKDGVGGRLAVSYVNSRRTDPVTGALSPAPFDVTWSGTAVLDIPLGNGFSASGAYRYATGKPFTPVAGAIRDGTTYRPFYGAPYSERIPHFTRVDLSLSRYQRLSRANTLVIFASLGNVLDRSNVYQYRYSEDYSKRIAVRSVFNRSVYLGGSLTHTRN